MPQENPPTELKAFEIVQRKFATIGITAKFATQPYPLNGRICIGFSILIPYITFLCVFIFNYAETFSEYTQSIYIATAASVFNLALLLLILKKKVLYECINRLNQLINTSE